MSSTGSSSTSGTSRRERTPEEIERDIAVTRDRLAVTVDEIADRVAPKNVARRAVAAARAQVVDEQGNIRVERVAPVGVALALLLGIRLTLTLIRARRGRR